MSISEIQSAESLRSLMATAQYWENENITVEEMIEDLEQLIEVAEGNIDYNQFIERLGVQGIKYS